MIRFSTELETLLELGTHAKALESALAYDAEYDRNTTALIDGLEENASTLFEEADVLAQLDEERVFVIALVARRRCPARCARTWSRSSS